MALRLKKAPDYKETRNWLVLDEADEIVGVVFWEVGAGGWHDAEAPSFPYTASWLGSNKEEALDKLERKRTKKNPGLSLTQELRMGHSLKQCLICSVCEQVIDWERVEETRQLDELFGHEKYAICPCCQQDNRYNMDDPEYQKRAKAWHGRVGGPRKRPDKSKLRRACGYCGGNHDIGVCPKYWKK